MPVISRPQPGRLPRLVYVRSIEDSNIWRIDTLGPGLPALSAPALAISSTRLDYNPHFSPDGGRVAFDSNRSGNVEIWLADSDGSNAVQLTSLRSSSGFANWSPDGRLIARRVSPATGGVAEALVVCSATAVARGLKAPGLPVNTPFHTLLAFQHK